MLLLDVQLALLSLAPVPLMLLVFYFARRELGETARRQQEAISRTNNALESAFGGIRIVKAFNGQAGQEQRLGAILEERIGIQFNLARLVVLVHQMDNIVARIGQVVVLAVGGLQVLDGTLSLGTLYAFYVFLDMLIRPMMDLPNLFVTARQAFVSIDRVDEVIRYPVPERAGAAAPDPLARLELRDVAFRYAPDLPPALEDITLSVEAGQKVAVVGAVGSGKSTLLRLVAGLLHPERGAYRFNGAEFDAWDWSRLRHRIGYVPQESLLFSETILANVAFGRDIDEAWAASCLDAAQMAPDLERMPEGVATKLGRTGTLVSGGQKQRIAIARALAGRPDLLLLDDCTSSLDARNEDRFWQRLAETSPDTAVLVVSHRPTTIRRADHIVVLDRGRLVDQGTHAELADRCAPYREFLVAEERRERLQ
jgi:ATP-binding cassette subfamily B protein